MRNKTTITTIILDAAIILAVALFMFVIRPWDKADKKDKADYGPAPELTIAEQEGIEPVEPIVGNSKPVDVEPVDGIRITAPANALDKDREFKITPVSDQDWKMLENKMADASDEQMLFCFDLDAGMEPDEHQPGEFTLTLNLEKMGIPPILHKHLTVWRQAGDQLYKYTSWLQNGKLTFSSDQNCFVIFALPSGMALLKTVVGALVILGGATYAYETWEKHATTGDLYKNFFTMNKDAVKFEIKDSYGDFTVYFRFKDTEYADRFDTYKENCENFVRRGKELEEKAETEYGRQVEEKYNEERAEWTTWQKIMGSAEAKRKARAAIDKAAILAKLCEEDALLKRYAEGMQLPPSIIDIGEQLKVANRYLTDNQVCRPQTRNLEVNLVDTEHAGTSLAEYRNTATKMPYIFVNYEQLVKGRTRYSRKGKGEAMLITLTHELFHHRQKCKFLDFRTEETTAAYIETGAAKYYVEHGEISPDTDNETLCFTHRTHYERFAMPFNHMVVIGNADEAYTYADFMDFLERKTLQKKPLMGGALITEYSYSATHAENYMKWFGIKDEKTFARYLEEFCILHVSDIYLVLKGLEKESDRLKPVIVSREKPIVQVPLGSPAIGLSYYVAPFELMDNSKAPFNAFVSWKDVHYDHDYLSFYIGTSPGYSTVEKGEFFSGEKWWHQGACFSGKPANTVLYQSFTVVALYAPDAPKIEKVKRDYVSFKLPKPESVLVKNKYITRALVTCTLKDGSERRILASADKFGKKVKWTIDGIGEKDFSLTVRWISEGENRPVYESPDSKPAVHGAIPPTPEASANVSKEKKKKDEKKQEKKEEPVSFANQGEQDSQDKMSVMDSDLPDIVIDKLSIVIDIPDSEADGHQFDHSRAQQVYSAQELKVTKEKDGYRVVGQSNHNTVLSTGHEGDSGYPGSTYEDHIDLVMDEDFVAKEGSFSWSWTYHDLYTSGPKSTTWYKQLSTLSVRFIKDADFPSPYVTSSHVSQGYLMTTLSAAWKGQFGSYQRNFVLTTDDLKYSRKGSSNVELSYDFKEVK